ncbi:MAG: VIT and VWA domain-containing protein [Lachnospiraceae bacterium]|nr:VIT and VWA domain-containing protein [Lachnospiraceae bacterium]
MKKHQRLFCFLLTLLLIMSNAPAVHAAESEPKNEDQTAAPYFYVESGEVGVDCFPLKNTSVTANIEGTVADIHVIQTYANEGTAPINADYLFPASTKVTIHGMEMQIGDQRVTAVIKEKEEAKQEFETAKKEGKSASMLTEERANVFSMSVANIMPGDEVRIDLHYTELLTPTEGSYQFVFPTVVGPRYVSPVKDDSGNRDEWTAAPYLTEGTLPAAGYDIHVTVSAGVPISALSSSSHQVNIAWDDTSKAHVSLTNPLEYAGNRDFILNYKLTGEGIGTGLTLNQGSNENFFMLMVQPPERVTVTEIPPREYIFVLDVSGSMSGFPLDTAKELMKNLIADLRETDTFNLILFSGTSYQMSYRSLPATKENISKAVRLISEQSGAGGTELSSALADALAIPADADVSRNIVIITDGYISGESEIFQMINENINQADFFSFGIGSSVNRYLIEGISKIGQGEPFIVTEAKEASETADRFSAYIQSPVLTDIQVSFEGFDAYDVEPALLPTLYAQKPLVLLGKWKGEPNGTIKISGKNGSGDFSQSISVSDALSSSGDTLGYLWARKRVERLTDYGVNGNNPEVKEEVTQLGLSYHMMTPYTSFISVLDTVRNPGAEGTDVDQPLPLPLNVSNLAVGYRSGSEPGEVILLTALAVILLAPFLFKKTTLLSQRRKRTNL